jgi:hypothetical protein
MSEVIAMSPLDLEVVKRFKTLMLDAGVPLIQLVLFGSRARGDADPDSDYDVLVEVVGLNSAVRKLVGRCAWEAGFEQGALITPVLVTSDEIEHGPMRSSLLMLAVRQDGVAV